jgi:sarcosine/dimethylglycine N-methyltransferase
MLQQHYVEMAVVERKFQRAGGLKRHPLAAATREVIEPTGFRTLAWQDDSEAANAWFAQLRASGPPPSPNLGVVMGPGFVQLSANLGRNLMEGRLGILTAVFDAASTKT